MKNYYEKNIGDKISRKYFHYRLASEEENEEISGYRHNSVTPFMLNKSIPIVVSDEIS